MGTYTKSLGLIEAKMQAEVDAHYSAYLGKLEINRELLPEPKAKRDHTATQEYIEAAQKARDRAIREEQPLFDDLQRDVERALTAAPTHQQLAYLQTLSLKPNLKESDIVNAGIAVKGNAVAETNVCALAEREGIISSKINQPPELMELCSKIEEYRELRKLRINNYLLVQQDGQICDGPMSGWFVPGGGWSKTMEEAEDVLNRYGAQ